MKTKITTWIISSIAFSLLFYNQSPGINVALFSCIIGIGVALLTTHKSCTTYLTYLALLISSGACLLHGLSLAAVLGTISILILMYISSTEKPSFPIAIIQGIHKTIAGPLVFISSISNPKVSSNHKTDKAKRIFLKILYLAIPVVIASVFIVFYANSNQAFSDLLGNWNWNISWGFIFFTIMGVYLLFGYFFTPNEASALKFDQDTPSTLVRTRNPLNKVLNILFKFKIEVLTGVLLFSLLNLILLTVITVDLIDLILSNEFLTNSDYSNNVHSGITALILSIVSAIGLILYYFRGNLNFYSKNKHIKLLAKVWMILNAVFVISTLTRNLHYIDHLGLTYKRIGVIIYLILTLIGIYFTWQKIYSLKTNWYLFKKTLWVFFLTMTCYPLFNWDKIITDYNCHKSKSPDIEYLMDLSTKNLESLLSYQAFRVTDSMNNTFYHPKVIDQLLRFQKRTNTKGFQSYNFTDAYIEETILNHNASGDFYVTCINSPTSDDLEVLSCNEGIQHLILNSPYGDILESLRKFPNLKKITVYNLSYRGSSDFSSIETELLGIEINIIPTQQELL